MTPPGFCRVCDVMCDIDTTECHECHKKRAALWLRANQQLPKPLPPSRFIEKKMKGELKLYRITIAPRSASTGLQNALDDGCEMMVLGTDGNEACAKILDEMPDSPVVSPTRITVTEMTGPFDHGYIISYTPF